MVKYSDKFELRIIQEYLNDSLSYKLLARKYAILPFLLVVDTPETTYHYHIKQIKKENFDNPLEAEIGKLFITCDERYGYKRITEKFKKIGYMVNHKKVYISPIFNLYHGEVIS